MSESYMNTKKTVFSILIICFSHLLNVFFYLLFLLNKTLFITTTTLKSLQLMDESPTKITKNNICNIISKGAKCFNKLVPTHFNKLF
jgi:hypothetical protein